MRGLVLLEWVGTFADCLSRLSSTLTRNRRLSGLGCKLAVFLAMNKGDKLCDHSVVAFLDCSNDRVLLSCAHYLCVSSPLQLSSFCFFVRQSGICLVVQSNFVLLSPISRVLSRRVFSVFFSCTVSPRGSVCASSRFSLHLVFFVLSPPGTGGTPGIR